MEPRGGSVRGGLSWARVPARDSGPGCCPPSVAFSPSPAESPLGKPRPGASSLPLPKKHQERMSRMLLYCNKFVDSAHYI